MAAHWPDVKPPASFSCQAQIVHVVEHGAAPTRCRSTTTTAAWRWTSTGWQATTFTQLTRLGSVWGTIDESVCAFTDKILQQ